MRFADQVVVITGGAGGVGRMVARRCLDEGARVVLNSRRQEVLEQAREELDPTGERVELVAGDVSDQQTAQTLIQTAAQQFGRVDVLVNSTGIFRPTPFLEQTGQHLDEALNSILRPTYWASQAAAGRMVEQGQGGAIVHVGSMWALDAIATTPTSAYSAAQAGRHALTKNMAIELAEHHIRVNTVALAFVETPAYERFMTAQQARQTLDAVHGFHPLGYHGQPSDVVEAILFLASRQASWITGTTLPIDGGVLAGRSPAHSAAESSSGTAEE